MSQKPQCFIPTLSCVCQHLHVYEMHCTSYCGGIIIISMIVVSSLEFYNSVCSCAIYSQGECVAACTVVVVVLHII